MASIIGILSGVVSIGIGICWILVLIKMFTDKENGGPVKGILGIVCGLYAFIWGWQNNARHNLKTVMNAWTALFIVAIVLQIVMRLVV